MSLTSCRHLQKWFDDTKVVSSSLELITGVTATVKWRKELEEIAVVSGVELATFGANIFELLQIGAAIENEWVL